jgi:hypothetical protein
MATTRTSAKPSKSTAVLVENPKTLFLITSLQNRYRYTYPDQGFYFQYNRSLKAE